MKLSEFIEIPARELAELLDMTETTLSKYFNGHRNPTLTTIENMAEKLDMTPQDVMTGIFARRKNKQKLEILA